MAAKVITYIDVVCRIRYRIRSSDQGSLSTIWSILYVQRHMQSRADDSNGKTQEKEEAEAKIKDARERETKADKRNGK